MYKHIKTKALLVKSSEKGFALIAAIMACLILLAVGMLVFGLSTQDIRISVKVVGDKRSLEAVEEGIQMLIQNFVRSNPSAYTGQVERADNKSFYNISVAQVPARNPEYVSLAGFSDFSLKRYTVVISGTNTEYGTQATVSVGIGAVSGNAGGPTGTPTGYK
ncbi:MAG TPA: hypothetical protein VEF33_09235 [Syntrophales bacterium]|nr:hypothetical protein [Syntrophales bacterium]